MATGGWPDDWLARRQGEGCVLCGRSEIEDDEWGTRLFSGSAVDAFAVKTGVVAGYVIAVWRGRHVAEPTELDPAEAAAYWREVTHVGRAVERCFSPAKMNYETLGNIVPHLHTHLVPRPWQGDPSPLAPLSHDHLMAPRQPVAQVSDTVRRVGAALAELGPPER